MSGRERVAPKVEDAVDLGGVDEALVQAPQDPYEALVDPVLAGLRDDSGCLLVEVDPDGEIVQASGPDGRSYASNAAVTKSLNSRGVVVVGVDGSPASRSAVRWAARYAASRTSVVRLVSAFDSQEPANRQVAEGHVRDAAALLDQENPPDAVITDGEPAHVILAAAEDAELVVVGRHGTSGLVHSALGSVGDTCARMASCPVVVVPQG